MVIGRQGAEKEKIQAQLSKMTGKDVLVNICLLYTSRCV